MTELQKKIITFIVLATGLSFFQVMGFTAELDKPDRIETIYGSFDAWKMSQDEFNRYRIELIVFTFVAEMIIAFLLVKTLREQEVMKKTPTTGGV